MTEWHWKRCFRTRTMIVYTRDVFMRHPVFYCVYSVPCTYFILQTARVAHAILHHEVLCTRNRRHVVSLTSEWHLLQQTQYGVGLCVCVCVSVFLSVTTIIKNIVDGFVPNFMGRSLGGREDQVRVLLRSVEGCGSNGQKIGDCFRGDL